VISYESFFSTLADNVNLVLSIYMNFGASPSVSRALMLAVYFRDLAGARGITHLANLSVLEVVLGLCVCVARIF
jgi:hypothetical protein